VFVSYRRDDVPDATYRLVDALISRFGKDDVFIDVDTIELGAPFADVIDDWVARCDVLLAIIGERWLDAKDENGARRLESPGDFVRLEIEAALLRDIRVVPVLIHNAPVPREADLPDSMAQLPGRNAIQITRTHWDLDVAKLMAAIERIAGERAAAASKMSGDPPLPAGERAHQSQPAPPASRDPVAHTAAGGWPAEAGASPAGPSGRPGRSPGNGRLLWRASGLAVAAAVVGTAIAVLASKGPSATPSQRTTQPTVTGSHPGSSAGPVAPAVSSSRTISTPSTEGSSGGSASSAIVAQQRHGSTAGKTASTSTLAGKTTSTSAPPGPLEVVSHYWEDIGAHHFSAAYVYLEPDSIGQSESQFVAGERAEGIEGAQFTGRTVSVNESSGRVNLESLVTRDVRNGCREWTGWYAMSALGGRWLVAKANIQPQQCRG
jgi:hypothetical protein